MEGPHRPNGEEDQLYAWISPKEPADQQHRHKSWSFLSTSSAHISILCLCMEPTHRTIKTQAGMDQRRAARYYANRYHNTSSVTEMLGDLQWETLGSRRTKIQLTMLFKIVNDLVDIPAEEHLSPASTRTRGNWTSRPLTNSTLTNSAPDKLGPNKLGP